MLDEAEPGPAYARPRLNREVVGDRPDDRDAETSLRELVALEGRRLVRIEPLAVVDDLVAEPVEPELVRDLDVAAAVRAVRMADRVRDGLRQRELEIRHRVVADLSHPAEPGQGETAERDVLGLRRNAQENRALTVAVRQNRCCAVAHRVHPTPHSAGSGT